VPPAEQLHAGLLLAQLALCSYRDLIGVVVVALFARAPQVDINVLVRREVKLLGSYASQPADYRSAARELSSGEDVAAALVTAFPLEDALAALEATAGGAVTKAALVP